VLKPTTNWQFFPRTTRIPKFLGEVIDVFMRFDVSISTSVVNHELSSDEILGLLRASLVELGYQVESGKGKLQKISVPVLHGRNGSIEKSFDADAFSLELRTVIEVEAGRAVSNYQFLKDLFQACVMPDVDYLVIAVRNNYRKSNDFEKICQFIETIFVSDRLTLPLRGVLIIGY
jgi:hypothetical protein